MPTLAELRSQLPELQGLTDDQAVDAVQQAFYPDFSRDEIARDLGVKIAPPPPPPTPERTLGSNLKDIGVAAMRGGVGAVESVVGLGNLVSGGQAGKLVEDVGIDLKGAKKYWGEGFSDAQKAAFKKVEDAEGLWEVVKAAVKNPSVAGLSLVESAPLILGGGLAARGMVAGATALSPRLAAQMATARAAPFVASAGARANTAAIPIVAGALGEGVVGAGSAAEQIRQQSGTGTLTGDQAPLALATGAANAAFGLIGGKVAQSMGLKDIDTLLVGAASNPRAAKGVVRRVLEGFVSEGMLEELPQSISEQVMQNMALDRPLDEGVNQAAVLGLMAGGIMGAGANVMSGGDAARPGPKDILAAPDVDTAIKTAEQAIPKPATPAAAPVATPELVIPPNPVGDTLTGSSMADLLQRQTDPLSRTAQQPAPTLTGNTPADLLTGQAADPLQGLARDNALAREDQRQEDRTGQVVDSLTRGAAEDAQSVRQWDARRQPVLPELDIAIQPGDVLQKNGAPWPEAGAKLHLKAVLKGQGEIVPVAGGGYIVRPKKKEQPDEKITDAPGRAGGNGSATAGANGTAAAATPRGGNDVGGNADRRGPVDGAAQGIDGGGNVADAAERYTSPKAKQALADRLNSGQAPYIDTHEEGGGKKEYRAKGVGTTDPDMALTLAPTEDERRAARRAEANIELADTPEERNAAKQELAAALTPAARRAAAAPAPAGPPGAELENGFRQGPAVGERYRVSDISATGGLMLEKRLPAGTVAGFYVGKDGGLVDADGVNLIGDGVELLWKPENDQDRQEARDILQEMGALALTDPKRAALKARLKALVTKAPDAKSPAAAPAPAAPAPVPAPAGPAEAGQPPADRADRAPGDQPAADAKPALNEAGDRWTRMPAAERSAVLDRTAAKDKAKARIVNQPWDDLADGWRRAIARSMGELQQQDARAELDAAKADPEGRELSPAAQALNEQEGAARFAATSQRPVTESLRPAPAAENWADAADQPRDPESGQFVDAGVGAVKVPPTVDAALTADMSKQQARVKRMRSDADGRDMVDLEEKKAAQLKVTAAEATLRKMRTTRFDAEDAAVKAVADGNFKPFEAHEDLFPSAADALRALMPPATGSRITNPDGSYFNIPKAKRGAKPTGDGGATPQASAAAPTVPTEMAGFAGGKIIGQNTDGEDIREDDRGVRTVGGVQETVGMVPTRAPGGGIRYALELPEHTGRYLTAEEAKAAQADRKESPALPPKADKPAASANTIFTDEMAAAARARLKAKLGRLGSGIDPEMLQDGIVLAGNHIEKGARTFAAFARAMLDDMGEAIRPYLKQFYMAVKYDPRAGAVTKDMSSAAFVEEFDMDAIAAPSDTGAVESQQPSADTGGKGAAAQDDEKPEPLFGANDDTRRNAAVDDQPLDDQLPGPGQGNGTGGNAEAGGSLRAPDADGNGQSESGGAGRGNGLDGSAQPVLPGTPAEVRPLADGPVNHTEDRPRPLAGENPGNFTITDAFGLGTGTDGDKIAANLAALRTLRQVQSESRYPTADEQAAMARYVGWGGLKTVFDPKKEGANDQYGRAQTELKSLLNPAEYRAANGSIRNAHYTAQGVVDAMWRVVRHMGFKGGRVLEPTVGIGNFIGRQPADMAASTEWHASELDTVTGQMAAMLYPEANVLAATGFQDAPFADGAFDLSIGNPPFGQQPITDKNPHRKHLSGMKIHNYIIAKTGMHLRPGGVMAMVVTHRFLDTANPEARDVLAKDFKFLGAFRLPNDAFAANAGTEVVTDVVFLQKLRPDQERNRDAHWLHTEGSIEVDGQSIRVNRYYQENPTHILGRSAMDGTMYAGRKNEDGSGEYTVHSDGRDIGQAIDQLIEDGKLGQMTENALVRNNNDMAQAPAMLAQSDLPVGGVMLDDAGKIMRRELNDSYGNAVVQEITPETLWKEQAAEWQALRQAVVDVKEAAEAGTLTPDDAAEVLALSKFLYKSDGAEQGKPSKATEGIYKLVNDLATPGAFKWSHADTLTQITITLGRKKLGEDGYRSLKGMLDLRNRTLALIKAEQADAPDMEQLRAELNTAYDAFVKANGFLSDPANANLLEGDVGAEAGLEASYTAAVSAAVAKSSGTPARKASAKKADILSTRVNFPYKEISKADSAADALFASLSEHGKVDLPYMAKITDKTVVQVIQDLTEGDHPQLFQDPESGEYQEAERYLSGNVKHKLAVARASGIEANVKALEQAQPEPKTRAQVKPNIRGMWMPTEIFKEFLEAIGYNDPTVTAIQSQGILSGSGERVTLTDLGIQFRHSKRTPMDMFNSAASGKPIKITVRTSDGKTYTDEQGTKEVNALTERMAKVFQEWAYSNDSRAERIVAAFNENMNTHTPRSYDGSKYLKPVGASPSIALRRTQKDAGWRMMQEKTILLDHVVGAGKTYTIITGIMERRRMGLSRKPMVMVPNHLVTQWARDFYKLYPGAKVLAANPADFARKNRRRLLARIATGDYDAVIVGHTSVGFMETPGDDLRTIIDEKLAGLKEALAEARRSKESKRTLGQIEDRIDRYEQKLKELSERTVDDIGIDFKSLGVDYLAVDEAHEFKNLEYSTSGDRVVGMNDPKGSKKAFDLYGKVRGLLARGGGVAFATGTPVSNSLVEIYTVMSYLAHDELKLRGQEHFDSWSGAYAATETRLEYTATQKLKPRRVLAGLNNLSALRQLYEQFADIITMSDLKRIHTEEMVEKNKKRKADGEPELRTDFPVPKVAGGRRQLVSLPITDSQREYMDYLVARMGAIERNKGDKEYARIDNPLNVLTDARKMSLDVRIVDPGAARDENGKVATAAKRIMDNYKKWMDDRGTQLVFCDLSTPAKTAEKDAKRIISEVADKLYGKDAKRIKTQISGQTFEKQWQMLAERAEELAEDGSLSEDRRDDIATFMAAIEDPEATMNVADIGFSVYDDLRSLLVEKGIPESEIAFIHDYNTPEQKERLFDRVNNGYVRVLLGSSMKMGAGMNAQQRLVALHHMDAPWRPSDVEQREGRIIRQGNLLYARDPDGFDVDIKAYSTQNTSDTVMWQILERKSGAIEQFREGGLDSVEEEGGDSDQYAEFMATSTGNPVFRQKLEAERLLTELDAEIGGALITRSNATAFLERYPMAIAEAQRRLESAQAYDASTASYGGESGTAEEFEAAMKAANDDYLERYAAWTEKKAAAELELAKWELELELTRGKKPTLPTMPSQPNLMTKSVREASGYARAMALALQESKQDKSVLITMGAGKIQIEGSKVGEQMLWSITASHQGVTFRLDNSSADNPSASSRLMTALTPRSVRGAMESVANSEAGTIDSLTRQKKEADKNGAIAVDTRKRDAAREELNWLKAQVSFAEMKTDIERGERNNRFIARDRRRALGQAEKAVLKPIQSFEVDGANYTTTGIEGRVEYAVVLEATRDSDKRPVLAVEQFEGQGANRKSVGYSVIEQPKSLRKSLRNLAQMGSEEANTADVVFSQAAFRQGAPAKGERRSAAMLQYEADAITDLWRRKPTVIAVDSWRSNGVPAAVRREAEERISRGGAAPRAVFADGRVYLFAEALDSKTMPESLYHEVLGHYGLRGHFGEELDRELEMVATLRQADMRRIFEQTGMDPNNAANRIRAAEEVVVYLAQTRPNLSVVQRIVAAIRNWLRANVPGFKDMELSDADIIQKYILPARQYVEGGGPRGPGGKTTMEPAFQGGDANRPFYSALARGIEGLTAKALPVEGWRGAVNNLVNTGKAKADEVEWSGLREWLEMQTGKVSKDDVLNYLQANGVQVQEVVLGGGEPKVITSDQALDRLRNGLPVGWRRGDQVVQMHSPDSVVDDNSFYREVVDAGDAQWIDTGTNVGGEVTNTKYGNYTLPGGQNYREVLLTLPTPEDDRKPAAKRIGDQMAKLREEAAPGVDYMRTPEYEDLQKQMRALNERPAPESYQSSHWGSTQNILAHIRLNDRTDADGNRVLFVEEIQSDWGQEGKKKGFGDKPSRKGVVVPDDIRRVNGEPFYAIEWEDGARSGGYASRESAERAMSERAMDGRKGIPLAPFVTSTDKWLSLALKRVITMAAQEGYDRVAFVTGRQSADRYDLSKKVGRVTWTPDMNGGTLVATDLEDRNFIVSETNVSPEKLEDYIGKDAAQKLIDQPLKDGSKTLKGDGLRIGGEGMMTFYDKIVPTAANKLLAKLGGAGLTTVELQIPGQKAGATDSNSGAVIGPNGTAGQNLDATGFTITPAMREKAAGGLPLFQQRRADQTETPEFRAWFGDSKVVDAQGKPLVVYHGTHSDITAFDASKVKGRFPNSEGFYFTSKPLHASVYADSINNAAEDFNPNSRFIKPAAEGGNVMPAYVSLQNPKILTVSAWGTLESRVDGDGGAQVRAAREAGHDGVIVKREAGDEWDGMLVIAFRPEQIKSATGNRGTFDPANPNIMFQQAIDDGNLNQPRDFFQMGKDVVREIGATPGKLHWWHKSVGTQYNLARKNPMYRRVFERVQDFLNDVSLYATEAADAAPNIMPKLESWRDILKTAMPAADAKAIQAPIFEGTLTWARDADGQPVKVMDLEEAAKALTTQDKAQEMLRRNLVDPKVLRMWQGLPIDQYEQAVNTRYQNAALRPGVVWTGAELKRMFKLDENQIGLYREALASVKESITRLALSDMVRYAGDDVGAVREEVMGAKDILAGAETLRDQLLQLRDEQPERADVLEKTANKVMDKAERAQKLIAEGYFPLMRFGHYTVTVRGEDGAVKFFSMYENRFEAQRAAQKLSQDLPEGDYVTRGTMNEEAYKLFAGVTPETLELFGEMLGLEGDGTSAADKVFQSYLKLARDNRSSMKRLIHRKGTAGFSDDVGRVLAGFVYSNARQISRNLHQGEIDRAVRDINDPEAGGDKDAGELGQQATRLAEYVKNPVEEAQALRGLLFAQYLGASIASAMANMTQPFAVTMPWLSQYGGMKKAGAQMASALKVAWAKKTGDDALDAALKKAEDEGIVAPQEVHHLMAQAQGRGNLKAGDGTAVGDAMAATNNALSRLTLAWGKPFATAELFNRRVTFVAAYRTAVEQKIGNPYAFAERAIRETQFIYNKGNRPQWARGAFGATIFTFKTYSISYLELLERMWNAGEPGSEERAAGRRAAFFAMGMLLLLGGGGGLPFMEDVEDVVDGLAQRMGYNFSLQQKRREFFQEAFGKAFGGFLEKGVSGLPGAPIDVAGRLGLGNVLPGTGLLQKKDSYTSDVTEMIGPAGDLFTRVAKSANLAGEGRIIDAGLEVSPTAARNLAKSVDMAATGIYKDTRGYKVLDVDAYDALAKGIGFQPGAVATVQEGDRAAQLMVQRTRARESEIAAKWAKGFAENDDALKAEARAELQRWNEKNPETPIRIRIQDVLKRAQKMRQTRAERIEKSAPKEVRQEARRLMGEQ